MKIHCQDRTPQEPYFTGLGDSICLAWLSEGAKGSADPIELVADGHRRLLLECLGQGNCIAKDATGARRPSGCYNLELADKCKRPRIDYVREFLGIKTLPKRPQATLPLPMTDWAKGQIDKLRINGGPVALLFPETHWTPRKWPANYWVDLSWQLKEAGIGNAIMVERDDGKWHGAPVRYWEHNLMQIGAMMVAADLTIANDSMPAWYSGTLNAERKTLALMGPTSPLIFGYIDSVVCLQSKKLECVGCHFAQPFRAACDQGCMSLYSLLVSDVLGVAKGMLNGQRK